MPQFRPLRAVGAAGAAAALLAGSLAAATAAQAAARPAIAGSHPSFAVPASRVGAAASSGIMTGRVYLAGRDPAGLTAYATAASTPGSALYRHFLSPAQVDARFGTTPGQLAAVESWLRGSGLTVTRVANTVADGYVAIRGTLAAASRAFNVSFARYHLAGQGTVRAPQQAATTPASVARSVLAVTGLSTARQQMRPLTATPRLPKPGPNFWVARPCNAYFSQKIATSRPTAYGKHQPWALCGYQPSQIRSAYGVTASGRTGAGQTVAVVDPYASPTMRADANKYATVVGDKPFRAGQYQQFLPGKFTEAGPRQCDASGWYGEQTLDVESVHGTAPGARVRFVSAASCEDIDLADALAKIVNRHLASIVSNSWGGTEDGSAGTIDVYHTIFEAGAAEGIAFMFSSGDNGYESPGEDPGFSDKIQVDYPTSDPFVTAVGGTSLAVGKSDSYQFETSWGTMLDPLAKNGKNWQLTPPGKFPADYDGSGGGGTSTVFDQPGYQKAVVPASLSTRLPDGKTSKAPMRELPDISAYADPATGFLVGETVLEPNGKTFGFALSRIGGTSVSCPTFAGIEADAQQAAGGALGFANPLIYSVDHSTAAVKAYHDVTDHPLGSTRLAQVRPDFTNPATKKGPIVFNLRTLGINGEGTAALRATPGYDDSTGVGSPKFYVTVIGAVFHR